MKVTDEMVNRFLMWNLPIDFAPDCGISFKQESDYEHPVFGRSKYEPMGTNLLSADQARAMLEHVLTDIQPAAPVEPKLKRCVADDKATSGEYWKGYAEGLAEDFDTLAAQYLALKNAAPVELPRTVRLGDAPETLNINDKSFWVIGYNKAIEDAQAAIAAGRKAS